MKKIKAVKPYIYPNQLNFKDKPFEAWKALGGATVRGRYPLWLHKLMFSFDMPTLWHGEARLVFVQPVSLYFDTFFTAPFHEMIPFIWDCWPCYYDMMEKWLKRHKVKTAIFTSSQEMTEMQRRCPNVTMIWCPEAVDTSLYKEGKPLKDRNIDLLEFGRSNWSVVGGTKYDDINHVTTKVGNKFIYTDEQLFEAMADAKVTICLPKSMTHPKTAQGVETLTQRYWEAMLSRIVIVGHSPDELSNLVGYNPIIELPKDKTEGKELIYNILDHIAEYQDNVDRNFETAQKLGDWIVRLQELRMKLRTYAYYL